MNYPCPLCHNAEFFQPRVRQHSFQIQNHHLMFRTLCSIIQPDFLQSPKFSPNSSKKRISTRILKKKLRNRPSPSPSPPPKQTTFVGKVRSVKKNSRTFLSPKPTVHRSDESPGKPTVFSGLPEGNFQDHRCACR